MIETELKAMLSETQFNTLETAFVWDKIKEQTNHYYISDDNILKKHGITFRIRTIDDTNILQIKKHTDSIGALQVSEESEFEICDIPDKFLSDDVLRYTGVKTEAAYIGQLTTLRYSYMYNPDVEICLDKNTYLGCTDFEIEIEYTTEIPAVLLDMLKKSGVDFKKECKGKFSRFMTRLLK